MDHFKNFCAKVLKRKPQRDPKLRHSRSLPNLPLPNWENDPYSSPVIPPPPPPKPSKSQSFRSERSVPSYKPAHQHHAPRHTGRSDHMGSRDRADRLQRRAENEQRTAFDGLNLSQGQYPRDDSPSDVNLSTANGKLKNSAAIKLQLLNGVKFHDAAAGRQAVFVHENNHHQAFQTAEIVNDAPPNDVIHPRNVQHNATQPFKTSQTSKASPGLFKTRRYSPKNLKLYPDHIARAMATPEMEPYPMTRYLKERFPDRACLLETPTIVELARGPRGAALRPNTYAPPIRDPGIFINNGRDASDWRPYNPFPDHYGVPKPKSTGFLSRIARHRT